MRIKDHADRYRHIRFARRDGVLEVTLHTRGGPAPWGSSATALHAEVKLLSDIVRAADRAVSADLAHPARAVPGDGVHAVWPMLLAPIAGAISCLPGSVGPRRTRWRRAWMRRCCPRMR